MTIREPRDPRALRHVPKEVYVLVRVSVLSQPRAQFFPDPWRMLYDGTLHHTSNVEVAVVR